MIRIGTCSWTEKTLVQTGDFYPRGINTAKERLEFYGSNFDTVEVDATYYAIPDISVSRLWNDVSPEGFTFHLKVYGALTGHGINPKTLAPDLRAMVAQSQQKKDYVSIDKNSPLIGCIAKRFIEFASPLYESGKLGVIVFQYPPWFFYNEKNIGFILENRDIMEGLPVAVEFRHGSWLNPPDRAQKMFRLLDKEGIVYICADEPQYGSLATVGFIPEVTAQTAYFRLHGRNKQNWLKRNVQTASRYDYNYSNEELQQMIPAFINTQNTARQTFVMFNNCHGSKAVNNAITLKQIIGGLQKKS